MLLRVVFAQFILKCRVHIKILGLVQLELAFRAILATQPTVLMNYENLHRH